MMNTSFDKYRHFVKNFTQLHKQAASIPVGQSSPLNKRGERGPLVMIFSPHPDDECIVGALPLRMLQEMDARVSNVAVTLGSKRERRQGRLEELTKACDTLGFSLLVPAEAGLERVNPSTRNDDAAHWSGNTAVIAEILESALPSILFFPHANDFNSTHIGVNLLLMDAIAQVQQQHPTWSPLIFETEFWHMMENPNLMVAISDEDEAKLVFALSAHSGEVERNPYHLSHPARMLDNVTRGAEVVGGQGGVAPECNFAMIYRCSKVVRGTPKPCWDGGKVIGPDESLETLI